MTYRLPIPKDAPFAIGYTFEGKPHDYLPDVVGTLTNGKMFIAEAGMEDDKRSDRNLAKAEAARRLARLVGGVFWIGTERTLTRAHHYNLVFLHARRKIFPAYAEIVQAVRETWPWGEVASVEEVESRLVGRWPAHLVEAAIWKLVGDSLASGHLLVDLERHTLDRTLPLALLPTAGSKAALAIVAPKNNDEELALGNQLFSALGLSLRGRWSDRKPKLMGYLHQYGTECLIVDDAHDLSLEHLMFIKELTDQGRLQSDHPLGLCLVAAGRGNTIPPIKETLDLPDPTWLQFRRRLDKLEPFCQIAGHTSEEVREILATLETVYQELFPQLNLRRWAGSIYTWLTQPVLDPTHSGRVTMDYLMKLVTTALEWSYQAGETDVRAETLEQAASLLVLRRDTLWIIDGAGPSCDSRPSESPEQGNGSGTEPEREAIQTNGKPNTTETNISAGDSVRTAKATKCRFSGVVPIDLQRFQESSIRLVECPDCGATRTPEPRGGVLRFKSHDKRKTTTPNAGQRWARIDSDWAVVGGEGSRRGDP